MPYQNLQDGLYLLKKKSAQKGAEHFGILDIGNRMRNPGVTVNHPVIVHQTPPSIRVDWLQNTGIWQVLDRIVDEADAIQRMNAAFRNPSYSLFGNNCEHFARYVATGARESYQLQAAGLVAGLTAIAFMLIQDEDGFER